MVMYDREEYETWSEDMGAPLTPEEHRARQNLFLAMLMETCNVGRSAKAAGVDRGTIYRWRDEDPEFAKRWDRAKELGVTALEDEAHRRAFEGVNKPVVYQGLVQIQETPLLNDQGQPVLNSNLQQVMVETPVTVKEYSDQLAMFLLKAHAPEKYRERTEIRHSADESLAAQLADARRRMHNPGGDDE